MTQTRVRKPRPPALSFTAAAMARLHEILDGQPDGAGVRMGVKKGGCAGMEYVFDLCPAAEPFDEVVEQDGVRAFIDPKSLLFVLGSEVDFVSDDLSSRFVFNNPNQTDACGCGESVTLVAKASQPPTS